MENMRRLLTNNIWLAALAAALFATGFIASIAVQNFIWLNRFGSLIICIGIIIMARPTILGEDIKMHVIMAETNLSDLDPKHYEITGEPVPDFVVQDLKSRIAVGVLGPLIVFIGTLANGFGDLLNNVAGYGV